VKRVFVADPHPVTRKGIAAVVSAGRELEVADETESGKEVLMSLDPAAHDILLMELRLKDSSGLEVLEELHRRLSPIPALVYSSLPMETYAVPCIRAGAAGILSKEASPEALLTALATVVEGRMYIPRVVARDMASVPIARGESRPSVGSTLSPRELQVYRALVAGNAIKEIAAAMQVTPSSVITYRRRILRKMGLCTTRELLRYAYSRSDYGI
jgi:DNA-binding NarL/FixJ family response regulator